MSMETNYCAHILDDKKKALTFIKYHRNVDAQYLGSLYEFVKTAIKFRLPDNGIILGLDDTDKFLKEYRDTFHLPYPVVALEYSSSNALNREAEKSVILAYEGGGLIVVIPFMQFEGVWLPHHLALEFEPGLVLPDPGPIPFRFRLLWGQDGVLCNQDVQSSSVLGVNNLCELLAALSCRNVTTEDCPSPRALNKKREARGKQPFFTYKTLMVDVPGNDSEGTALGGTHASPRVHLRRGHIRRLPTGNVWVRAAIVGDKSKGMIHKDYAVRASA